MRIRIAVASQLELKGYTKPASGKPYIYVAYHASVKDLLKKTSEREYYGYGVAKKTGGRGDGLLETAPLPTWSRMRRALSYWTSLM
jgi:hypothetical protein